MKKAFLFIIALMIAVAMPLTVMGTEKNTKQEETTINEKDKINVYIFKGATCGYCARALAFFESIKDDYGKYFNLVEYEVWYDQDNKDLMNRVADYFGESVDGVPYIIIGDKTFGGYASDFDNDIKEAILEAYNDKSYEDIVEKVKNNEASETNYDTLIVIGIFALVIGGFGALIYFSRK